MCCLTDKTKETKVAVSSASFLIDLPQIPTPTDTLCRHFQRRKTFHEKA